jgi:hypothetical protein
MKTSLVALGAAVMAFAGVAYAQEHMPPTGDPMGAATVTRAEAQAKAADMFARLDANGDGKLDQADREAMIGKRFDAMDTNHDGQLSKQEFIAAHQAMHGGPGMDGPPVAGMEGHRMGPGMMGHGMGGGMHGPMGRMAAMADTNGDHAISRDEFMAAAMKRFDAADTNHDGKLTPEERKAAFRAGMKARREHRMDHDMPPPPPPPPAPAGGK